MHFRGTLYTLLVMTALPALANSHPPIPGRGAPSRASTLHVAASRPARTARRVPGIGRAQVINGFAVTPRWVVRAHEAGGADYVAGRGNIFVLVDVQVKRQGAHGAYFVDPQDFTLVTPQGTVIESEQFGMTHELNARHIYRQPVEGVIGFEVPAGSTGLSLLWQPFFDSNPDAQAQWRLSSVKRTVQYYP